MDDEINYNELVENALMEVVKAALNHACDFGLPGDQHFYVTFKTHYTGVKIPTHLTERYADEMTIVLQHQYWDLTVEDSYFSVGLSFNQKQETLVIPYAALTAFADPSVQFGLQFNTDIEDIDPLPELEEPVETDDLPSEHEENAEPKEQKPAEVITLDAFRKK